MGLFAKAFVVVMFIMSAWAVGGQHFQADLSQEIAAGDAQVHPGVSRYLQEEQLDGAIALAERTKKSHVAGCSAKLSPK